MGMARTTTLWAQGWHRSTASWAQEWRGVPNITASWRTMLLQAREWHRGLGNDTYVVDGVTGSSRGRLWRVKVPQPWSGTMVRRLWGGLEDGVEALRRTQ
jgi:hypothetical protein